MDHIDILSTIEKSIRPLPHAVESAPAPAIHSQPTTSTSTVIKTKTLKLKIEPDISTTINSHITNKELADSEKAEFNDFSENTGKHTESDILYPTLNDPLFNVKIASRKEFYDTQYDGIVTDVKTKANQMCNSEFELMPHQHFVKNFMSFQTPYNSLFLYHELGTGKTCSAIGIAEEMRQYLKNVGIKQKIIVVAFPIVQDNFKLQLFDESKLKEENGIWDIKNCVGNLLLAEINPMNVIGLSRDVIIGKIKNIISKNYSFKGYIEFANEISKIVEIDPKIPERERRRIITDNINKHYNNSLIIIDEVHNIRSVNESNYKRTMRNFLEIVKYSKFMRLLLLSATPMYDSYKEIIWITNMMNLNDKRSQIKISDVFDKYGEFKPEQTTNAGDIVEGGKSLLKRKLIGYMSFIRGENPYTFPYRIYPTEFSPENVLSPVNFAIPTIQYNKKPVESQLTLLNLYITKLGTYQEQAYSAIINGTTFYPDALSGVNTNTETEDDMENKSDSMSQKLLIIPNQALNIVFPAISFDPANMRMDTTNCIGKSGLRSCFDYVDNSFKTPPEKKDFMYKPEILERYGRFLHPDNIREYSSKISSICESVKKSTGIVMIFSQYIDSGVIPMALALEEMGFSRYNSVNSTQLLKSRDSPPFNFSTMRPREDTDERFIQANYVMITGDKSLSPSNIADLKVLTDKKNAYGENIKVVIISRAGAEGLDFKNIRQIHIMDAWYNINRVKQIIGRGVRNLSHCSLPFEERNVELYLHASVLNETPQMECVDLYVYRMAERKAVTIGKVTRLLKETAVDCILNIKQTNFTVDNMIEVAANQQVIMKVSSGLTIPFKIGDKPYSDTCDYMEKCPFDCDNANSVDSDALLTNMYSVDFIKNNNDAIVKRIKDLFKEQFFYKKQHLVNAINLSKQYPLEHIYYALTYMIKNKTEHIVDRYGRIGALINKGDYYLFQPAEITDDKISVYERSAPIEFKRRVVSFETVDDIAVNINEDEDEDESEVDENEEEEEEDEEEEEKGEEEGEETGVDEGDKLKPDVKLIKRCVRILKNLLGKFKDALNFEILSSSQNKWDWSMHASQVAIHLERTHGFSLNDYERMVVYHLLDSLFIDEKIAIITALYGSFKSILYSMVETIRQDIRVLFNKFNAIMMNYFDELVMKIGEEPAVRRGILLVNNINDVLLYVQNPNNANEWNLGQPTDYESNEGNVLGKKFGDVIRTYIINPVKIFRYMGFFSVFKEREIIFKVKDMTQITNRQYKGSRADQAGKEAIIKILNTIQTGVVYNRKNVSKIGQHGLSIVLEFLMRKMTTEGGGNIYYFLTGPQAYLLRDTIKI